MNPFLPGNGLVVIPARAGSKRLPGKNARLLGGIPLLAWSIRAALACPRLGRVFVSTDSPDYAETARHFGAEVPFLRSPETSTDAASTKDVVVEALRRFEQERSFSPSWIVILQPTSPFRSEATLNRGIDVFLQSGGRSVVAVAPVRTPASWMVDLDAEGCLVERAADATSLPAYAYCGTFYALATKTLKERDSLYTEQIRGLVIDDLAEALDIDSPKDWELAERLAPSFARDVPRR